MCEWSTSMVGNIVINSSIGSKGWISVSRMSESIWVILFWVNEDSLNEASKSIYDMIFEWVKMYQVV